MAPSAERLAAVIGRPVRHSLSPAMHNAVFRATGRPWRFVALELLEGGVGDAIAAMAPLGIAGYAVTMPHKAAAAEVVDELEPAAAALRSVNTVVLRDDGSTLGASTDGTGFVDWIAACGFEMANRRVVVLGAGGAARSIVDAAARAGAADVAVVNRSHERAVAAAALAVAARVGSHDDIGGADLLVNATSVGMGTGSDELPLDAELLRPDLTVADIVYHPLDTALLRVARNAGATTIDGLGMLVHQAVLQQQLWTGDRPNPELLRDAAEAELEARSAEADG
ncbi:MAG: shikimate dehydrogenase [Ilumatobacter sp.]|nr:shikimate dehydrogenase [Ilumatobacter sp.]